MSIKVDDGGSYYCFDMGNSIERVTLITAQESCLFCYIIPHIGE